MVYGYGTETYGYSVRGERLLVETVVSSGNPIYVPDWLHHELRFYDLNSQLLATFEVKCKSPCANNPNAPYYPVEKAEKRRVYFAGKLISFGSTTAVTDRLGSLIAAKEGVTVKRYRYYPYGEAIGTQEWDKPQFATYTRDARAASTRHEPAVRPDLGTVHGGGSVRSQRGSGGSGGLEPVRICAGDPITFNDPMGLCVNIGPTSAGYGYMPSGCTIGAMNWGPRPSNFELYGQGNAIGIPGAQPDSLDQAAR